MKSGAVVKVYPHGSPESAARGVARLVSDSQTSIAVVFDTMPPFAVVRGGGMTVSKWGVMLIGIREMLNGEPWGPWIEVVGGGHFEIEEITDDETADRAAN